jgi:biotin-dependent carboxylase-like uncharacterized protein
LKPGLQTTIQSRPRNGLRHNGIAASGAADPLSLALANKLVGNDWDAAALESTLLGPTLRFDADCPFAITGAEADVRLNDNATLYHETIFAKAGDELVIGGSEAGARTYIAVAGGFTVDSVLGSPSTDLLACFGGHEGRALAGMDVLGVATKSAEKLSTPEQYRLPMSSSWALRATTSFESEQLDERSRERLFDTNWTVGRRADRMGLKLEGATLDVSSDGRMPSGGVFPGTVQCPEDGSPYILSVDAGTVGGYPRVAQITRADRHLIGQLRPGDHVRLLHRDPDQAIDSLREKISYWEAWLPEIAIILA